MFKDRLLTVRLNMCVLFNLVCAHPRESMSTGVSRRTLGSQVTTQVSACAVVHFEMGPPVCFCDGHGQID